MSDLASAMESAPQEAAIVAELKAGSEDASTWLIAQYNQPVYSLVYRLLDDPCDAADTTQEVFIKVFRGIRKFHADSSLKTWIYRIALHEASNHRRWWFRHKRRETTIESRHEGGEDHAPAVERHAGRRGQVSAAKTCMTKSYARGWNANCKHWLSPTGQR